MIAKTDVKLSEGAKSVVKRLGNLKEFVFAEGIEGVKAADGTLWVSTEIDRDEAVLREIIRKIQSLRKSMGLVVSDRIILHYHGFPLDRYYDRLKDEVGCSEIVDDEKGEEFDTGFGKIKLYIEKTPN